MEKNEKMELRTLGSQFHLFILLHFNSFSIKFNFIFFLVFSWSDSDLRSRDKDLQFLLSILFLGKNSIFMSWFSFSRKDMVTVIKFIMVGLLIKGLNDDLSKVFRHANILILDFFIFSGQNQVKRVRSPFKGELNFNFVFRLDVFIFGHVRSKSTLDNKVHVSSILSNMFRHRSMGNFNLNFIQSSFLVTSLFTRFLLLFMDINKLTSDSLVFRRFFNLGSELISKFRDLSGILSAFSRFLRRSAFLNLISRNTSGTSNFNLVFFTGLSKTNSILVENFQFA